MVQWIKCLFGLHTWIKVVWVETPEPNKWIWAEDHACRGLWEIKGGGLSGLSHRHPIEGEGG